MELGLRINKVPVELGQQLSRETFGAATMRRAGFLRRLLTHQRLSQTIFAIDDCELEGLNDSLHIYPCTHSYLNRDRQWRTRATFFLHEDRLRRILFQVVEGQTAAVNFLERFESAAESLIGQPSVRERRTAEWKEAGTRVTTRLHRDRVNADFVIELAD
jgi:hypothetical protein